MSILFSLKNLQINDPDSPEINSKEKIKSPLCYACKHPSVFSLGCKRSRGDIDKRPSLPDFKYAEQVRTVRVRRPSVREGVSAARDAIITL